MLISMRRQESFHYWYRDADPTSFCILSKNFKALNQYTVILAGFHCDHDEYCLLSVECLDKFCEKI